MENRRTRYMKKPNGPAFSATLSICEGKKHEVKRMLKAVGCKIFYLHRDRMGGLSLDAFLKPGKFRLLKENEIELLLQ